MNSKKINLNKLFTTQDGGYAILFAVVVVSIISMLAIGLSNTTYKQLILSSLANDSQLSFYQSDNATECALYAENVVGMASITSPWKCGKDSNNSDYSFTITGPTGDPQNYNFVPSINGTSIPCFNFNITKTTMPPIDTNIYARGYNSCNSTSPKTVEREIRVQYK